MRVSSESEKEEWVKKLKERATGSLTNKRRLSAATAREKVRTYVFFVTCYPNA